MCILNQYNQHKCALFLNFCVLHHYKDQKTFIYFYFVFNQLSLPILFLDINYQTLINCYFSLCGRIAPRNQAAHRQSDHHHLLQASLLNCSKKRYCQLPGPLFKSLKFHLYNCPQRSSWSLLGFCRDFKHFQLKILFLLYPDHSLCYQYYENAVRCF